MENYALAIANYFIKLAHNENKVIRPLKLMKLVYIAHGYMLALLDRPTDGAKLEHVEAWQYGPVFPSVYHSFKLYGNRPIEAMTTAIDFSKIGVSDDIQVTPMLTDEDEKRVCRFVWKNYGIYTDSTLVTTLHAKGTPWEKLYRPGKNVVIPDADTKKHYNAVIDKTIENVRREQQT